MGNAAYVQAAVEHALGNVDFTQGRRLQLGESVAQPIKSVVVEKLEGASLDYSDTFRITVEGFGPLLQRISSVIRTFDFLKSVADKLRADGRTSVNRPTNAYSPVRVEGRGWSSDADGKPIPNLAPSDDGTTFLYRPEIDYALNNATVLPPPDNVGVPGLDFEEGGSPISRWLTKPSLGGGSCSSSSSSCASCRRSSATSTRTSSTARARRSSGSSTNCPTPTRSGRSGTFRARTATHFGRRSTRRRSPSRPWTSPRPRTKRAPRVGSETRTGSGPRDDASARDGVCSMHDQYSTLAWRLPGKSRLVRRQTSLKP